MNPLRSSVDEPLCKQPIKSATEQRAKQRETKDICELVHDVNLYRKLKQKEPQFLWLPFIFVA
jgi:hypothetical protein